MEDKILVSKNEELKKIIEWNNTYREYSLDRCLHELIEEQVKRSPESVAVCFEDKRVCYAELNRLSNQCANYLRSLGIGPDSIVGILMERSVELVVALLGILKAGGAYLPLDPGYPRERLSFMLEDADVYVLLTQKRYKDMLGAFEGTVFCMDGDRDFISDESVDNLEIINKPDNLAYVIYTSGSTGKPKGCMLPHNAICNRLLWMQEKYGLTDKDTVLQKTPFTFDVSVWEFFWPLISGACLVLAKPEGHKDSNYLVDIIRREKVTTCHFVPSMLRYFVSNPNVDTCNSLRQVFTSGEALPYELMMDFKSRLGAKLQNLYGPTEAAVDVTYWECEERTDKKVPIGRPISNIRIYILNSEMEQVAVGEEGELHIGGIGLARGYLNRPELTAEKFVNDPFSTEPGAKLYKTGDKASFMPDGNIEYLGRMDFQVKLRGNRIELGEIESVLRDYESVEEAVVLVKEEASSDPKLVAYIAVKGELPDSKQIRTYVKSKLPEYMVPNIVVPLEAIPVTQHGKLDRGALPWPVKPKTVEADKEVKAHTKKEVKLRSNITDTLVEHLERVLNITGINAEDDLFDIGATSLTMVQLVERIQKQFGVSIPVDVFLDEPTIGAVTAYICKDLEARTDKNIYEAGNVGSFDTDIPNDKTKTVKEKIVKTEIINELTGYFTGLLGIEGITPGDDLFDIGATSLTMVQIVEKIQKAYGVSILAEVFLDEPTINAIADYIISDKGILSNTEKQEIIEDGSAVQGINVRQIKTLRDVSGTDRIIALEGFELKDWAFKKGVARRNFVKEAISAATFGRFLSLLRQEVIDGEPKYLYPSAGGLNAVQAYIYVKEAAVDGIDKGIYYYHPEKNILYPVNKTVQIDSGVFFEYDRLAFEDAGFAIFFIAQLDAITPVYTEISSSLVVLDAGYMGQLLLSRQEDFNLGLCPVQGMDSEGFRDLFKLDKGHKFVHCILGGKLGSQSEEQGLNEPYKGILEYLQKVDNTVAGCDASYSVNKAFAGLQDFGMNQSFKNMKFLNKEEHDDFHAQHLNIRRFKDDRDIVTLDGQSFRLCDYQLRSSKRDYLEKPVPKGQFGKFLSLLRQWNREGRSCYLYPSVSGAYEVQAYLYIKKNGVEAMEEGIYYYHPEKHALVLVTSPLSKKIKPSYTPFNRKQYQGSAFCLFLVGQMDVLKPFYNEDSLYLALLEAGYIGQLLMDRQAEFDLGLCPIGGVDFGKISADFKLDEGQILLHSFTCGCFEHNIPADRDFLEVGRGTQEKAEGFLESIPLNKKRMVIQHDIAIIGISGRYPGAENPDEYWRNLSEGRYCFSELPSDREKLLKYRENEATSSMEAQKNGGYLKNIDCFDSMLFNISPAEACCMDPQERLFMESVWECLENAGYTAEGLINTCSRVGVFVGAMWNDYQNQSSGSREKGQGVQASSLHSSIANRVSFFFNFTGPSIALNTSCSSAMTAIHFACESIKRGECDAAIVGGVNLITHFYHEDLLSSLDMLSKDNECRPFGAQANGWVAGEGVGAFLIRPIEDAERNRDYIHGIIKGTAIGHSGRTARFGAPRAETQSQLISKVIEDAGVSVESISYIEAAAPGAGIADASEVDAVRKVFKNRSEASSPYIIGSVKGNIGHLESASAMSQITKVLLQLKHRQIAPTVKSRPVNPFIRIEGSGLEIAEQLKPWKNRCSKGVEMNGPLRALVNAFGATGSGGHIIIEEYINSERKCDRTEKQFFIPVSAASKSQLKQYVEKLCKFLRENEGLYIGDIGYTLQTGHTHMEERLAVIADSTGELIEKLEIFLEGRENADYIYQGSVSDLEENKSSNGITELNSIAEQWLKGASVEWSALNKGDERRIPLPSYVFEKIRHWVKENSLKTVNTQECKVVESSLVIENKALSVYEPEEQGLLSKTEDYLKLLFAEVSEFPVSRISVKAPLEKYGIASAMIKELNRRLEKDFGELPKSLFFEYQTLHELAKYFIERHREQLSVLMGFSGQTPAFEAIKNAPAVKKMGKALGAGETGLAVAGNCDIAIIGLSGRYPKAGTVNEYWENLKNGVDCISEIPSERWDYRKYYDPRRHVPGKAYSKWGGFIEDVDKFDPRFFNISPREAEILDPQERLFLETAWHTFEDAGYSRRSLKDDYDGRVGVFVGVMYGEYQLLNMGNSEFPVFSSFSSIANRVSYTFDLHGPSMAVDTMCSSSLTALHLAVESMRRGECEIAIAGGVNVSLHPYKYISHSQLTMSSSDGRCKSFGEGGDGFVPGEGVGAVLLKPLHKAVQDGDHIHGIIKATAVNHGGKTNGYTVPNPAAQSRLISEALAKAKVDPRTISYIEAHGTGTSLGDPIEIAGLSKSFEEYTDEKQFCAIGSAKSNIGHLESAAGIAGLTKVLLQMKHKQLAPSLHSKKLNPNINFEKTPFFVQQELEEWKQPLIETNGKTAICPRRASISSFGAGGANAYVLVEEYEAPFEVSGDKDVDECAVILSAWSEDKLKECAKNLLNEITGQRFTDCELPDLGYTLQVGREELEFRFATVTASLMELEEKLKAFLEGRDDMPDMYVGQTKNSKDHLSDFTEDEDLNEAVGKWILRKKYNRLLEYWVRGLSIDWNMLYGSKRPRRISLPGYPFERERYWIPTSDDGNFAGKIMTEQSKTFRLRNSGGKVARKAEINSQGVQTQEEEEHFELMTFEEVWQEETFGDPSPVGYKTLVCFLSSPDMQKEISEGLKALNSETNLIFVSEGQNCKKLSRQSYVIESFNCDTYEEVFKNIREDWGEVDSVFYLWALENQRHIFDISSIVFILQALASTKTRIKRLIAAGEYEDMLEGCYIDSWIGFERSGGLVLPDTQMSVVFREIQERQDGSRMREWLDILWTELHSAKLQSVLYKIGKRYVCKIQPTVIEEDADLVRENGTYVITGGCGGLGFLFAEHIARTKRANLVLIGRSPMDETKRSKIKVLEALDSNVMYLQADVCDSIAMKDGLEAARERFGNIHGVLHAAGLQDYRNLLEKGINDFQKILDTKVKGTIILDQVLEKEPLDFVCYFSSISAVLGDFGSCDYAIGNRFQMAYADYRNHQKDLGKRSGKTVVINWPLWKDGGMNRGYEQDSSLYLKSSGQRALEAEEGLKLFGTLLAQSSTQHLVLVGKPSRVQRFLGITKGLTTPMVHQITALSGKGRRLEMKGMDIGQCLEYDLKEQIGRLLKISPKQLDTDENFADLGFDSISLAELASVLTGHYGIEVTPALFFGHSTIEKLLQYYLNEHQQIIQEFYRDGAEAEAEAEAVQQSCPVNISVSERSGRKKYKLSEKSGQLSMNEPIAVIGISGKFPGADTVEEFWENLKAGRNSITEIPAERWNWKEYYGDPNKETGKTNCKWGAFISDIDKFDPLFFEISPKEAELMDPQQRLFLEEAWHAMEDAGYMGDKIRGTLCGVYVGAEESQYGSLIGNNGQINSNRNATLPARIAYELNLKGPNVALTAACSSGLVAIHQACQALRQGDCGIAIAGGVSLNISPGIYAGLSSANMLSPDGKSYVFDQRANGLVPGEAVAVVVLKPLSKAIRDNDRIYGCIKASGVNYNGKSNGITAPNPLSQAELFKNVYEKNGINPSDIQCLISHSVGSKVGDTIEIQALTSVFREYTGEKQYCSISSVKPLVGHTFAASGAVSLIAMLMAMKNKTLLALNNFEKENQYINFSESPFLPSKENRSWESKDGRPRIGALSTSGISGTNAHMVVEEYIHTSGNQLEAYNGAEPQIFVFSAKNTERLLVATRQMLNFLKSEKSELQNLANIAYTLQTGREAMDRRVAVIASSRAELEEKLELFATSALEQLNGCQIFINYIEEAGADNTFDELSAQTSLKELDLDRVALLWVKGAAIPWEKLHEGMDVRIISLPAYPFKRRRCWVDSNTSEKASEKASERAEIVSDKEVCENKAAEFYTYGALDKNKEFREEYLTFCPFEEKIPGFSMSKTYLDPEKYSAEAEYMKAKQVEMRQVLFCSEDFYKINRLFDIGCGHGTDIIQIAEAFPHIETKGFTITKAQAVLGNQRIMQKGLYSRVEIFHKDSTKDNFPGTFDLIIGIEVCCHIRERNALFGNISAALKNGGKVLLMDFISNLRGKIEDPGIEVSIATREEWLEVLSHNGMVIEEIIDVSPQIANFLYDPEYKENIKDLPEVVQAALQNFAHNSIALEKGWTSYCLFKLRKEADWDEELLRDYNSGKMYNKTPYAEALDKMLKRGHIPYPQKKLREVLSLGEIDMNCQNAGNVFNRVESSQVKGELVEVLMKVLRLQRDEIEEVQTFRELGIGSVNAVELTEEINTRFDLNLPTSIMFEFSNLELLSNFIGENLKKSNRNSAHEGYKKTFTALNKPVMDLPVKSGNNSTSFFEKENSFEAPEAQNRKYLDDIAIIGLSCRCAGANDQNEFWDLISNGKNCIREIENKDWLDYLNRECGGHAPIRYGSMDGLEFFDPLFFNISPKEADAMDVAQRIVLEECYKALEDSGYDPSEFRGRPVGTVIGTMGIVPMSRDFSHYSMLGTDTSILASRISYHLDLKGPALAVNTACSSSLVAIDLACQKLKIKEIDVAIAGGITIYTHPGAFIPMNNAGMLSPTQECRPFDNDANGIIVGDGVGIVILKRLQDAVRDNDYIYGVIRGSGTNQDGQTSGITVPSFQSQSELEESIYRKNGINVEDIQYVEAHGTATKLGDPVEIHALTHALNKFTTKKRYCAIGSAKANIGHTTAAAGALSLIKVLLSMKYKKIAPSINFSKENEHIDFENSPFFVNTSLREWPVNSKGSRLAAVSSFGFSGTNAHLVVEEYSKNNGIEGFRHGKNLPGVLTVSSQTQDGLLEYAKKIKEYIQTQELVNLADMAYTFQVGRESMAYRVAIVFDDREMLVRQLEQLIGGDSTDSLNRFYGRVGKKQGINISDTEEGREYIRSLAQNRKIKKLAELWVFGSQIDWQAMYDRDTVRRVPGMPTYPFARERYWIQEINLKQSNDTGVAEKVAGVQNATDSGDELQAVLKKMVSKILRVPEEKIDEDEEFTEYGFDSISGMSLMNNIKECYNVELPIRMLFEHNSINRLSRYLIEENGVKPVKSKESDVLLKTGDIKGKIIDDPESGKDSVFPLNSLQGETMRSPLSIGQKGLWAVNQINPEDYTYNVVNAFRIRQYVDEGALKRAFEGVVLSHPLLRATVVLEDQEPVFVIKPEATFHFEIENTKVVFGSELKRIIGSKLFQPFDLENGPLMKVYLLKFSETEYILLLNLHHIVFDGPSMIVLIRDLLRFYSQAVGGKDLTLVPAKNTYKNFVDWQTGMLAGEGGRKSREYWMQKLKGELKPLTLPGEKQYIESGVVENRRYVTGLSPELTEKIRKLSLTQRVTPFVFMLSAFKSLLFHYTGQKDIIVGTVVDGRPDSKFEDLIGCFINVVALRSGISDDIFFTDQLKSIRDTMFEMMEHSSYPFSEVVNDKLGRRKGSNVPIVQVCFIFHNWFKATDQIVPDGKTAVENESLALEHIMDIFQGSPYDILLEVLEIENSYNISISYDENRFEHSAIVKMAEDYIELLKNITVNINQSIGEINSILRTEKTLIKTAAQTSQQNRDHEVKPGVVNCNAQEMRSIITSVYREVLNKQDLDKNANFFELGGNSMLLVKASLKLGELYKLDIKPAELFKNPTINSLAQYMENKNKNDMFKESRAKAEKRRELLMKING